MIAFLRAEVGGDLVRSILRNPDNQCFAHAVNLAEVYYDMCRVGGTEVAEQALATLTRSRVVRREDLSRDFCDSAATLKAVRRRVSLADCFGLTLAANLSAEFLTTDRHELEALTPEHRIRFIR